MKTKNCEECNVSFSYEANPSYPDNRKYCDSCSVSKKAQWEQRQAGVNSEYNPSENVAGQGQAVGKPVVNVPQSPANGTVKQETGEFQSTIWKHSVAPNSYEIGKAGCRFKLYFENVKELQAKIAELTQAGLLDVEDMIGKVPVEKI